MLIAFHLISGAMVGIEFIPADEKSGTRVVIDLLILRILIEKM